MNVPGDAPQIPPSSLPNIISHITTKQLPNTAPIAKGSTVQLPIRVRSPNSIDYDSGKEDVLDIQLQSSPNYPHLTPYVIFMRYLILIKKTTRSFLLRLRTIRKIRMR